MQGSIKLHKGTISALDPKTQRARAFIPDLNIPTWWLAVLNFHSLDSASYWMPDLQQPVWVLTDPHLRDGVILGGYYHGKNKAIASSEDLILHKSKDGSQFSFDRKSHELNASVKDGAIKLSNSGGASITLNKDGSIELKCTNLTIDSGKVAYKGGSYTLNGKEAASLNALDNGGHLIVSRGW